MRRYIIANSDNVIKVKNPDARSTLLDRYIQQYGLNFVYMVMFLYYKKNNITIPPYSDRIADSGISEDELWDMINYLHRSATALTTTDYSEFSVTSKLQYGRIPSNRRVYTGDYKKYKEWLYQ